VQCRIRRWRSRKDAASGAIRDRGTDAGVVGRVDSATRSVRRRFALPEQASRSPHLTVASSGRSPAGSRRLVANPNLRSFGLTFEPIDRRATECREVNRTSPGISSWVLMSLLRPVVREGANAIPSLRCATDGPLENSRISPWNLSSFHDLSRSRPLVTRTPTVIATFFGSRVFRIRVAGPAARRRRQNPGSSAARCRRLR